MSEKKLSFCQSCIQQTDNLKKSDILGRNYWLCDKCLNPLPKSSYELKRGERNKAWGKYKNRGTKDS